MRPGVELPRTAAEHHAQNGGDADLRVPAERRGVEVALVLSGGLMAAALLDPAVAVLAALWAVAVAVVVRSDLARFIIPDEASWVIALLGVLASVVATPDLQPSRAGVESLLRGAVAFGLFWGIARAYRMRTGREGLGFGDVKLAGASGIWLSFAQQAIALELACLAAIGVVLLSTRGAGLRHAAVPFGAFLAPCAWLAFVAGPSIVTFAGERWP